MRSKVATLLFLDKTNVPAPRIFDYNVNGGNPIGMAYILMEKLPGKSLRWSVVPPEQRKKVMSQLADIYIELQAFPFDQMGSLNYPGTDQVGPFARESLTDYCDGQMRQIGPLPSHKEFLLMNIQILLD
jgi:aminoglycoside phosphotransferase (APT) family kinase protein